MSLRLQVPRLFLFVREVHPIISLAVSSVTRTYYLACRYVMQCVTPAQRCLRISSHICSAKPVLSSPLHLQVSSDATSLMQTLFSRLQDILNLSTCDLSTQSCVFEMCIGIQMLLFRIDRRLLASQQSSCTLPCASKCRASFPLYVKFIPSTSFHTLQCAFWHLHTRNGGLCGITKGGGACLRGFQVRGGYVKKRSMSVPCAFCANSYRTSSKITTAQRGFTGTLRQTAVPWT